MNMGSTASSAPTYTVPMREIVALEHPTMIIDIDNGLKTLGSSVPLQQLLNTNGYEGCFPLYLRTSDPTCAPVLSSNTPSSNILLKITVPKRTGRKRKRGSDEPFVQDETATTQEEPQVTEVNGKSSLLRSHSRLDNPKDLLRTLKDNIGEYQIEAVGSIDQTHRYRGISDFHYSTSHGTFMTKFRETVLPGNVESLRKFKLDPSRGVKENEELIPPPIFSDKTIPVNWGYHQNSNIKVFTDENTGETILTNHSRAPKLNTYYIPFDTPTIPNSPPTLPPPDLILESLLIELRAALFERPIWTRRAIMNRIPRNNPGVYLLKPAIQYVAYQFRGGPWRDAIVRYGVDPRSSPEYRIYQTLFFKIVDNQPEPASSFATNNNSGSAPLNTPWHDKRSEYTRKAHPSLLSSDSHIFNGTQVSLDGKIWQVCDITDPLLVRLLSTTTLRTECDLHSDGWFCNGTWAKIRAVMRTKISAIRIGREMLDEDFQQTLALPDIVKDRVRVSAHMPNLGLGVDEVIDENDGRDGNENDGDAFGAVEGQGKGQAELGATAETRGKAWRTRKTREVKRRLRRKLPGSRSNMGFGRAGSRIDGRYLGTRRGGARSKREGKGKENDVLDPSGSVRDHLATIGIGIEDVFDGGAETVSDSGLELLRRLEDEQSDLSEKGEEKQDEEEGDYEEVGDESEDGQGM